MDVSRSCGGAEGAAAEADAVSCPLPSDRSRHRVGTKASSEHIQAGAEASTEAEAAAEGTLAAQAAEPPRQLPPEPPPKPPPLPLPSKVTQEAASRAGRKPQAKSFRP